MDADPKPHLLTSRSIRIFFGYGFLHSDGTFHSIHGTGEIGDKAVTRRGEDPTAMRGDQGIADGPVSVEGAKRADFISPHKAAVAFDVGGEDRGELSFDGWRVQPRHLPNYEYRPISWKIRGFSAILRPASEPSRTRTRFSPSQRDRGVQAQQGSFQTCP